MKYLNVNQCYYLGRNIDNNKAYLGICDIWITPPMKALKQALKTYEIDNFDSWYIETTKLSDLINDYDNYKDMLFNNKIEIKTILPEIIKTLLEKYPNIEILTRSREIKSIVNKIKNEKVKKGE